MSFQVLHKINRDLAVGYDTPIPANFHMKADSSPASSQSYNKNTTFSL